MIPIVIPTHGRAGQLRALTSFPDAVLCVAESQREAYAHAHPGQELCVHPDSVRGLSRKRQWIYEQFGTHVTVDDDIELRRLSQAQGESNKLDPGTPSQIVRNLVSSAEAMGAYLCGVSSATNPVAYRPEKPFRITGFVGAACMGIVAGSKLWFHPECHWDDFWISALNAYHHRLVLVDMRYCIVEPQQGRREGGSASSRTEDTYRESFELLREHYGDAIRRATGRPVKSKRGWEQKGPATQWQPVLSVPF